MYVSNIKGLPEIKNAVQAMHDMKNMGFDVYICTSPIIQSQYCAQEKLNWICKHLGPNWVEKVIITTDKVTYYSINQLMRH